MLEQFGEKCQIKENEILGRYATANRDLRPGEVLLYEKPVLIIPHWDSDLICANCYRGSHTICQKCNIFPLCMDCKSHSSFDCDFFSSKNINNKIPRNFLIENFQIFAPLKCLLFIENDVNGDDDEENGMIKEFLKMESHLIERKGTMIWENLDKNVIKPLQNSGIGKFLKKSNILDTDLIQQICGIFDVNSFEIRGPEPEKSLRGIYMKAALMAHNCVSNTMIAIDEKYEMKIYTTVGIKSGELIYYNYVNPLMGTEERQHYLKVGKYFHCHCQRCDDPTELGTYMSAIVCQKCLPNIGYYLNIKSKWICNNCSTIMTTSEVDKLLSKAKKDTVLAQNNIYELELLIGKLIKIFHPNHYLIIDLKQNVAAILRTICNDPMHSPGLAVYQRKLQICEEILPILKSLQPGISRLTGIALYEYFGPFIEILRRKMKNRKLSEKNYVIDLKKAENILKESVSMLLYEPVNTPEGLLAKNILLELKDLKKIINNYGK